MGNLSSVPQAVVMVWCSAVIACGPTAREKSTTTAVQPHWDLQGQKGEHVYEALGFLNEYAGRLDIDGDDSVERFYPNEEAPAATFGALLAVIEREQSISDRVKRVVNAEQFVTYHSQSLKQGLNGLYSVRQHEDSERVEGSAVTHLFISPAPFASLDSTLARAYVVGAYQRYGQGNSIVLANALHKAELLAALLRQVGCDDVSLESRTQGAPHANIVTFSPCKQVQQVLTVSRRVHPGRESPAS